LAVDVFAALADPVRRSLLRSLSVGPARVVDLAAAHPVSRPAVSKHLRVLTQAGLVSATEQGRERHYRLRREPLSVVAALLEELGESQPESQPGPFPASSVLDALETEVRRTTRERRRGTPNRRPQRHEETA
jgi:DNA-binding transcriptional ArsR family regulator